MVMGSVIQFIDRNGKLDQNKVNLNMKDRPVPNKIG